MISSLFCYTMEIKMKNKSVNAFYTAEILALVVALIFFAAGVCRRWSDMPVRRIIQQEL